jgi:hypothetical protein
MAKPTTPATVLAVLAYLVDQGHSLTAIQAAVADATQDSLDNASPEISVSVSRRVVAAPPHIVAKPAAQAAFDKALAEGRLRRFTPGVLGVAQLESEAKPARPAKVAPPADLTLADLGL